MLIKQYNNGVWNVVADGYVYGKYYTDKKSEQDTTLFNICYYTRKKKFSNEKEFLHLSCSCIGEQNERLVRHSKFNRSRIVIMGASQKDPELMTEHDYVSVWVIIPVGVIVDIWDYTLGMMKQDKKLEDAVNTNYEYVTDERAEDHSL